MFWKVSTNLQHFDESSGVIYFWFLVWAVESSGSSHSHLYYKMYMMLCVYILSLLFIAFYVYLLLWPDKNLIMWSYSKCV